MGNPVLVFDQEFTGSAGLATQFTVACRQVHVQIPVAVEQSGHISQVFGIAGNVADLAFNFTLITMINWKSMLT